jgi:hypothetical protein
LTGISHLTPTALLVEYHLDAATHGCTAGSSTRPVAWRRCRC